MRKPFRWNRNIRHRVTLASGGRRGALDFNRARPGGGTAYDHDVTLFGTTYSVSEGNSMSWHGHHSWPKQFGGAEGQPLMAVRHALHLSVLHPALYAYMRASGHDVAPQTTNPRNQRFIQQLRRSAALRQDVAEDLQTFYETVNAQTDPRMPSDAYMEGITHSLNRLANPDPTSNP